MKPRTAIQTAPCPIVATLARLGLAWALLASATPRLGAVELLTNRDFFSGLAGWKLSTRLAGWSPLQNLPDTPPLSLHPSGSMAMSGFQGVIVYQNLNVTGVAGRSVTLSLDLKKAYAPTGKTIAIYLDCQLTNGTTSRLTALSPDNDLMPSGVTTNVSATLNLPAGAARLVRLAVAKGNYGEFDAGNFSLTATGVTPAPVPVITSVAPPAGAYHAPVTIRGQNFGSTPATVLLNADPADDPTVMPMGGNPQIVSWSDTNVVVEPVEPNRSGRLTLLVNGVENQGDASFTLTSPNFKLDATPAQLTAIRGQRVPLLFRVNFLNGFQSTNGVNLMLVNPPGIGQWTGTPFQRSGGGVIFLDTATLTPGTYGCMLQSLEDYSYARFVNVPLNVRSVTNIVFTDSSYPAKVVASLTVTNQNQFYFYFNLIQSDGTTYGGTQFGPGMLPPVTVVSSDPNVVLVAQDNMGFNTYYAVGPGTADVTVTSVDGFSASLPITVNLPASPRITSASSFPGAVDNSGTSTNTFFWQGSGGAITWIGYQGSGNFSFDTAVRDYVAGTVTWPVGVPAGTMPGTYLFFATIGDEYSGVKRPLLMTVQNAASRGQIAGQLLAISAAPYAQAGGAMEVYKADGTPVVTNQIWGEGGGYLIPFLAPGDYKLRFVPSMTFAPQWYRDATNAAGATVVSVAAGQTVSNVNFVLVDAPVPPADLALATPVPHAGGVGLQFATVPGVEYALEYADALGASWNTAATLSGDGGTRTLSDPAPPVTARFYRVRMIAP